jgi:hypothetical protein
MPRKEAGEGRQHEKPLSLYPLTVNEAVDRLLQAPPEAHRRRKEKPSGPNADSNASKNPQE